MGKSCNLIPYKSSNNICKNFKLLPNSIFQWYRPQTWQVYLLLPALFISGIQKVSGWVHHVTLNCKGPIEHVKVVCSAKFQVWAKKV